MARKLPTKCDGYNHLALRQMGRWLLLGRGYANKSGMFFCPLGWEGGDRFLEKSSGTLIISGVLTSMAALGIIGQANLCQTRAVLSTVKVFGTSEDRQL